MKKYNINDSTLKHNLCINCGLCKFVCPQNAISMKRNKYGEINPVINKKKCTKCKICSQYCPTAKEKIKEESLKISSYNEPHLFGLQDATYYVAYNKDTVQRQKSCSGGVVTALVKYLFNANKIDGMIHTQRLWAKSGELHYIAKLSTSVEDVLENVSSSYQAIDFSSILEQLENNKVYFMTGTPCVIRGVKKVFNDYLKSKNIKIITCALVCSHNINSQFVDYFSDCHNILKDEALKINMRNKDNITDANNFNTHIYTQSKDLLKMNRFESGWTKLWRSYSFAMNVCNYCSDFWGYEADISVKDAWGEWAADPLGKNIVIIRNHELEQDFFNSDIEYEPVKYSVMSHHQRKTADYKQTESKNKNFKPIFYPCNIKNGLFKNKLTSKVSKFLYKNFGYKVTEVTLNLIDKCEFSKKQKSKTNKKQDYKIKRILVVGGYGYGNTGDEAQCAETLGILTNRYSGYQILNLSPNVEYSHETHPKFQHDFASRVLFFNQGRKNDCFSINKSIINKVQFIFKSILIYLNAFLVKHDLPTVLINASVSKLLYDLKTSSLLYFCGGGYLTGRTQSRLWDGVLLCRLAHIFNTPVVMSGQTIGIWRTAFNRFIAKWGFKHVKLISVRDDKFSLTDLEKIGLKGEIYFSTHDDALFCEKSEQPQVDTGNYITINFHYWQMSNHEKTLYLKKLNKIINLIIQNTDYNIVLIPMVRTDNDAMKDYVKKYPNSRIKIFEYDYDFRKIRRVIADSKICVTMKHHPIIFAMGESIPVISLINNDYYLHKNLGALLQYGQGDFIVNLESEDYLQQFEEKLNNTINNYNSIQSEILRNQEILKERKEHFLSLVDKLMLEKFHYKIKHNQNKKFLFWGASIYLEKYMKRWNMQYDNVLGMIDKDTNKTGKYIGRYKCYLPQDIEKLNPDEIIISVLHLNNNSKEEIKDYIKEINQNIKISSISD
ncbi:MAG: polysaccharide pyruvyl transferase family protein [Candidatus Gastranaerophilaceae bacterium]